jgi:HEAT repeat protein
MSEKDEEEAARTKRIASMLKDLKSKNERRIIGALKLVPHEGSPEMIKPMFELYGDAPTQEVRILLEKVLFNLKDPTCIPAMIELLKDDDAAAYHREVLSALWQSGLDVSEQLDLLVNIAIKSDYLTAFEVVTIIENIESFQDESLTACIAKMDQAVERKGETQSLLISLRQLLLDKLLG